MFTTARTRAFIERETTLTAFHEAGHAVIGHLGGLPVHDASITVHHALFGDTARVDGLVRHTPGGEALPEELADAQACCLLAGAEAETQWLRRTENLSPSALGARGTAEAASDFAQLRRVLRISSMSRGQAQRRTALLVVRHWAAITRVAEALRRRKRLTGSQLRALINH